MTKISLPIENVDLILGNNNIKSDDNFFADYFRNKNSPNSDLNIEDRDKLDPFEDYFM